MFRFRHSLFTLLFLLTKDCSSQAIPPAFNLVRGTNDFSIGKVTSIAQDRFGYMWFTDQTNNCLVRYDGYRVKIFRNDPSDSNSLSKTPFECIASDPSGNIWMATLMGADKFDASTNRFIHYTYPDRQKRDFSNILIDHTGYVWIGTMTGLVGLDPTTQKFTFYTHEVNNPSSLSCDRVRSLYEDKAGVLWVGTGVAFLINTKEGGLNRFNRNTRNFTQYLHDPNNPHSLASNKVRAIFEDSKGIFWVGTDGDGLHIMDRKNGTFERLSYDPRHPEKLSRPPVKKENPYDHITFITEDRSGKIWIGTYKEGIVCYDPLTKTTSHFTNTDKDRSKGFTDQSGWCAYTSRDGTLWISTEQANLFTIDPFQRGFSAVDLGDQLSHFLEDEVGNWWTTVGFSRGLMVTNPKTDDKRIFLHNTSDPNSLSDDNVTWLRQAHDGKIWVTTLNGANLFNPQTNSFKRYFYNRNTNNKPRRIGFGDPVFANQFYLDDTVVFAVMDANNETYFGTTKGLFVLNHNSGKIDHYINNPTDSTSLCSGWSINGFFEKGDGNIWMSVSPMHPGEGALELFNLKTKKFKHYLKGQEINTIFKSSNGRLWAATQKGLYYENDSLKTFLLAGDWNSQFKDAVFRSITEDDNKNIWGVSSLGIFRLNPNKNELCIYGNKFGIYDVAKYGYQLCDRLSTGELIFGNPRGFYRCYPREIVNPLPPKLLLTDFKIDGNSLSSGGEKNVFEGAVETAREINLRHDQNVFSIDFTAIHFNDPESNIVQYKLDGYENIWRNTGMEKTAYYFNIPPAHYVFRVRASSSYGVSSETAVNIIVHPAWWQTWWFRIVAIVLSVMVLYLLVRWWFKRRFTLQLERSEKDRQLAELSQKATELEMQALRAQMNPHFIFNSLNSINMFILENNKLQASEYLSKFSRLVRLILQNSQETFIPLEKELDALQLYLELESLRFQDKFEYRISVSDEIDITVLKVAPLIIQPYVENAIWHGLMHKKEHGHLAVELYQEGRTLLCKITDDGIGRKQASALKGSSAATKSLGMRITADRIALLQQQKDKNTSIFITDLMLPDGKPGGTEVLIKIPVNYD